MSVITQFLFGDFWLGAALGALFSVALWAGLALRLRFASHAMATTLTLILLLILCGLTGAGFVWVFIAYVLTGMICARIYALVFPGRPSS